MISKQDKVRGMFLGIAVGDALGMPVEGQTAEKIQKKYDRVINYVKPMRKKWEDRPLGSCTDDTQLSLAVAQGLIIAKKFDMHAIAEHHVKALEETTFGWGNGTREAIEKLKAGHEWRFSATRHFNGNGGGGNGVSMKIAPLAAYAFLRNRASVTNCIRLALMTHYTRLAVQSAVMQSYAVLYCLKTDQNEFEEFKFLAFARSKLKSIEQSMRKIVEGHNLEHPYDDPEYDMLTQANKLTFWKMMDREEAHQAFGNGNFFVYNSLPFSHYYFLKNPYSFGCVENVINAGGDTDSNGSQVGALLGALHGASIFPNYIVEGLLNAKEILNIADEFYETFYPRVLTNV